MRRIIIVLGLLGMTLVVMPCETDAEVAVRTDASGEYVSTVIIPGGPPWRPGIWGKRMRFGMRRDTTVLNPKGDLLGDMIPSIAEANAAPHHPWVIWSRYNGRDYDLVWSSWQRAWSRIAPVVAGSPAGDDLDADIAFAAAGRAVIAWWNRDAFDRGTVYFSMFLDNAWMEPVKISIDDFGGRHPRIQIRHRGGIVIHYESDDGSMEMIQPVRLLGHPDTITDDIDPQSYFVLLSTRVTFKGDTASTP